MLKYLKFFFLLPGPRYSWKKVTLVVILSTFVISGSVLVGYFFYDFKRGGEDPILQALVQTGPKCPTLPTPYLAEILDLSLDCPLSFSQFSLRDAYDRLNASTIIKEAHLKKIKPNIIYIDYSLREPIAFLEDYTNTGMDEEGALFPYNPYYAPRRLPFIYLGGEAPRSPWGEKVKESHFCIFRSLLDLLQSKNISRIDLSQIEACSWGKREIVIVMREGTILRLSPKNYVEQLSNYFILERKLLKVEGGSYIVDLRLPEVAYIQRI